MCEEWNGDVLDVGCVRWLAGGYDFELSEGAFVDGLPPSFVALVQRIIDACASCGTSLNGLP